MKRIIAITLPLLLIASLACAFEPGSFDCLIQAGEDYRLTLALADSSGVAINITGNSYAAQFRSAAAPAGTVFATYSAYATAPTSGTLVVKLSAAQTVKLSGKSGVWDLKETTPAGQTSYLLAGKAAVKPTVTR